MNAPRTIVPRKATPLVAGAALVVVLLGLFMAAPAVAAEAATPANDDLGSARALEGEHAVASGSNKLATREKGEPDHLASGSSMGQKSVWYRWTADEGGTVEANACESNFDTILAVYARDDAGELEQLADNDDGCSSRNQRGSALEFDVEAGETYWVSVSGYSGASAGGFRLRLDATV